MEAEMVPSLSPLLQSADEWREVLLLLPLLVALEAVLSADNAIALAAISRRLHDPARQRQALNIGLLLALVFRMGLILAARWVLDAWPLQLLAAGYLLWLCGRHLFGLDDSSAADEPPPEAGPAAAAAEDTSKGLAEPAGPTALHQARKEVGPTLGSIAITLALTDLAFSLDSVAAAVAVTDRLALVMAGGVLGVLALRLTAGLFVRWLEVFSRLETAGYLAVGLVGIRLVLRLVQPDLVIPEWLLLLFVASLFLWGFSSRNPSPVAQESQGSDTALQAPTLPQSGAEPATVPDTATVQGRGPDAAEPEQRSAAAPQQRPDQ
jgi:hypothetical protein